MPEPTNAPHLLCFGCGYVAEALAARLLKKGWRVSGTTRDTERAQALETLGIQPLIFDGETPLPEEALAGVTHIVHSVPPREEGDPVLLTHGETLAGLPNLEWFAYLSTTGVYGDHGGAWVTEESALQATSARSRRRVEAEAAWRALLESHGLPLHVFRLAGIYGPGRNQLAALRQGRARRIAKPGYVFGRIHVEDICRALEASIAAPQPGAVYNLADDLPEEAEVVVAYAADLLGIAPPPLVPFEEAELSPMARSFYLDCRRVSNKRLREELGVALAYPTYKEGLRALVEDERAAD